MLVFSICVALGAGFAHAGAVGLSAAEMRSQHQTDPPPTICGDLIDKVNNGSYVFPAADAFDCLRSVPFNNAVALRFIDYYNQTMQFQTTWTLLKDPPSGYQQPAVDMPKALADLRNNVATNVYKNQYAFESDLQYLIHQAHDTHLDLSAGIMAAFTFGSPYSLLSASIDGKEEPKLWIEEEISSYKSNHQDHRPSPIVLINGEDAVEYLTRFAAINSQGTLEPHADWNQLMGNPALDIQGRESIFYGGAIFYPGDQLNFTRADGTTLDTRWLAFYNEQHFTGPLATGGDFYNYFVLGLLPASYNSTPLPKFFNNSFIGGKDFVLDSDYIMTNWSDFAPAYPKDPVVTQDGLYQASHQVVTGYLLPGISTGVLSLPTFNQFNKAKETFIAAIETFLHNATTQSMQRVVIDVQQNWGGDVVLAFVAFKLFFPQAEAFAGSHKRDHHMADVLGKTFTDHWDRLSLDDEDEVDEKLALMGREWVVTPRMNANTGTNFTSWEEYASAVGYGGDSFSAPERYNLSNKNFDMSAFDGWIPRDYVEQPTQGQAYNASEIIILTDGICASACALFVEMMTQAGVRTVVVGGRPEPGPMQAVSGTRAAAKYTAAELDYDIINATTISSLRSNDSSLAFLSIPRDTGMWVRSAGFSLRDQLRSADDHEPLQLKYQPADCRIYWTLNNVGNFTQLWTDAATATWDDPGGCVAGSTGSRSHNSSYTSPRPPPRLNDSLLTKPVVMGTDFDANRGGLTNIARSALYSIQIIKTQNCNIHHPQQCDTNRGFICQRDKYDHEALTSGEGYCVSKCSSIDRRCSVKDQRCLLFPTSSESKNSRRERQRFYGYCMPLTSTAWLLTMSGKAVSQADTTIKASSLRRSPSN